MAYDILASFMFFTRLPLWRLSLKVPADSFRHVVYYWPLVGWLTGGLMALTYGLSSLIFPMQVSLLLAMASRLLLTGALHEDGLADFFDGFGGGVERERVLSIMKDSHVGTYGVIGLSFSLFLDELALGFSLFFLSLPSFLFYALVLQYWIFFYKD